MHKIAWGLVVVALGVAACSSDDDSGTKKATGGGAGQSGASGSGGSSGIGGSSGTDAGTDAANDAPTDGPSGVTLDEFCAPLEQEMCSWLTRCRTFFPNDCGSWWGTQNVQAICNQAKPAIAKGHLTYDPVQAAACLDNAKDFVCANGFPDVSSLHWSTPKKSTCYGVFKGTVPTGGDCHPYKFATECASGYCKADACPGKCTPFVALGGNCDDDNLCDPTIAHCQNGKCVKYVAEGAECSTIQCEPGLSCIFTSATQQHCVTLKKPGESCTYPTQCSPGVCLGGQCVSPSPSGGTCVTGSCPATERCDTDQGITGTCKPHPGVGQACLNGWCADGLGCFQDKCFAPAPLGGDCSVSNWCTSGLYCHASGGKSTCKTLGKVGEACGDDSPAVIPPLSPHRCEDALRCVPKALDAQNQATSWECQLPRALGQPCNPDSQTSCAQGYCSATTKQCTAPGSAGGVCTVKAVASCIAGYRCVSDKCEPKIATGQPCVAHASCVTGVCDIGGTDNCIEPCAKE
ncbi:MAG TPA: Dickkopf N-terminal cysteine-rich domain-containing protein [Polyangiaceae bacterium]|nr:Dickkopf N-terminal cysteine-rich domain-containing protein [Polyangiaceae bacterium]